MKTVIQKVIFSLENDTYLTDQVKWELSKYESLYLFFLENSHKNPVNFKQTRKAKLKL